MVIKHSKEDVDSFLRTCILKDSQHYSIYYFDELLYFKIYPTLMEIIENLAFMFIFIDKL